MTASVLELTNGAPPSTPTTGLLDVFSTPTKQLATIDDAGNLLQAPVIRQAETLAVKPQIARGNSASPVGNVSTTEKAMGLGLVAGFTITPQVTGRVLVVLAGVALNSTAAGDGTTVTGRYVVAPTAAPANGATSGLGTAFGLPQHFVGSTTAGQQGFVVMDIISGLALNVAVSVDVSLLAVTGGGASVKDVQVILVEL